MIKNNFSREEHIKIQNVIPPRKLRPIVNKNQPLITIESQQNDLSSSSLEKHQASNRTVKNNGLGNMIGNTQKLLKPQNTIGELSQYIFGSKTKLLSGVNFNDTKEYEFLYFQYSVNCYLQCILSVISIFSAIIEYESYYITLESKVLNSSGLIASIICLLSSVLLWITIVFDFLINCKLQYQTKKLPEEIWKKEPENIMHLTMVLVLCLVHPSPITRNINTVSYNDKYAVNVTIPLNAYLTMVCLFRVLFLIKFYLVNTVFYKPRSQRICEMNSFDTNLAFSLKGAMQMYPYHVYSILFALTIFISSFGLRIFERGLDESSGLYFSSYWNCLWCIIITMTTVGYGDYLPSSGAGRFFGILSCFCGVFLLSMLIVAITNILNLKGNEKSIYLILERVDLMAEKDILAAKLVSRYVKILKKMKSNSKEGSEIKQARIKLLYTLYKFKEKCKEIDKTFPSYSNFDKIIDSLAFVEKNVHDMKGKYDNLNLVLEKISSKLNIN